MRDFGVQCLQVGARSRAEFDLAAWLESDGSTIGSGQADEMVAIEILLPTGAISQGFEQFFDTAFAEIGNSLAIAIEDELLELETKLASPARAMAFLQGRAQLRTVS